MRLLLIAYEFPPSPSPQSLRWSYLVRELMALGVEVHVLTVEGWWPSTWIQPPSGTIVYRAQAGGVARLVTLARRWRRLRGSPENAGAAMAEVGGAGSGGPAGSLTAPASASASVRAPIPAAAVLNWKGRIVERANQVIARYTFPDERGRWEPFARERLRGLLDTLSPDVVVSSHEPATTLRLGRTAKELGFPWVADLGDPVLSFYTPKRWRNESQRLERWTCRNADVVTVTTEAAKWLLAGRHHVPGPRLAVLTQGYDATPTSPGLSGIGFDPALMELLYTGSFYQFRQPGALVEAVLATPGTRLNIATSRAPDWLPPLVEKHPAQLRLLGFVPHAQAVALQRSADVLINIANDDPVHVPGKVYEYLGSGRPILHLGGDEEEDVAARLVRKHRRGLVTGNDAGSIGAALVELAAIKRNVAWGERFDLDQSGVEQYQWRSIAKRLHTILAEAINTRRAGLDPPPVRQS